MSAHIELSQKSTEEAVSKAQKQTYPERKSMSLNRGQFTLHMAGRKLLRNKCVRKKEEVGYRYSEIQKWVEYFTFENT